jgi:hypothetical protein
MATILRLPDRDVVAECLEKEHRIIYPADLRPAPKGENSGADVNLRNIVGEAQSAIDAPSTGRPARRCSFLLPGVGAHQVGPLGDREAGGEPGF